MNYPDQIEAIKKNIFKTLHECAWNQKTSIASNFILTKRKQFFQEINDIDSYNLIYFDAFGYRVQPELWSDDIFIAMYKALKDNGVLVTYACRTSIKKAIHFTDNTASWLAGLFSSQNITNYDIIGISFYPYWSNFTTLTQLGSLVNTLKTTYNKDIMIFETGVPWTTSSSDGYTNIINSYGNFTYPITPIGQKQFFTDLVNTVYNAGGKGVIYWEPGWITSTFCDKWGQGSSYENLSFFNFSNNNSALPIFDVFDFCNGLSVSDNKYADINLYPNPATDKVNFEGVENGTIVTVYDVFGRILIRKHIETNSENINVSNLSSGILGNNS